jgi:hypothetical protein
LAARAIRTTTRVAQSCGPPQQTTPDISIRLRDLLNSNSSECTDPTKVNMKLMSPAARPKALCDWAYAQSHRSSRRPAVNSLGNKIHFARMPQVRTSEMYLSYKAKLNMSRIHCKSKI